MTAAGRCSRCGADTFYTYESCQVCGARLPWAGAFDLKKGGKIVFQ